MNLGEESISHVEKHLTSGFSGILGMGEDDEAPTHLVDNLIWEVRNREEVTPIVDVIPINRNEPNNLTLILPPFNYKK